ncbi:hypothetical protein MBANPS3_010330 [Mucor bainieri]
MESRVFFKALEVMDRLEDMTFIASEGLESVEPHLTPRYSKRRLNTLKISGAKIQPGVFHTLDRFFHAINALTFPCSLGKLTLTTEMEPMATPDVQHELQDMISLIQDTYLMVNLQRGVTLYFKLEPFSNNVQQSSFAEYFSYPQYANTFSIYCQLVASIELKLGDICAVIDIQQYCDTLDVELKELEP